MEEGIKVLNDNTEIKPIKDVDIKSTQASTPNNVSTSDNSDYIEGIPDWSIEPEVEIKR